MEWTYEKALDVIKETQEKKGDIFINNKNKKEYVFDDVEVHSETLEPMVTYFNDEGIRWTRPYYLFYEKFTRKG
ncbi:DUF1653 domain-containing protein [bacterium LRH843]|nr:DUF1653 domain-containing protein [bacterium LRH843]